MAILLANKLLAGPTNNTYAVLKSLDLVCDESEEKQLWCRSVSVIPILKLYSQYR